MERDRIKNRTQLNTDLPPELITEILLRLPVKSLLRFKTVCKAWHSIISDADFADSHYELGAARTQRLAFLASAATQLLSIDFNSSLHDESNTSALNLDLLIPNNYYYNFGTIYYNVHIIGSCRGFLLLDLNDIMCVWNPTTGVYKVVHWSPIQSSTLSFRFSVFLRGFGYDPVTDDYLVVLASYNRQIRDDHLIRVEFFSIRDDEWKEIVSTNLYYKQCSKFNENQMGWYLNDAIHWLTFSYSASKHVVLTFDLKEMCFSEISLPLHFEYDHFKLSILGILGGSLSLYTVRPDRSADLWTMKQYKVQSSWTKIAALSCEVIPTRCFNPICFADNGDIVGTNCRNGLAKFNTKGELIEHRAFDRTAAVMARYTETLFSLPGDDDEAEGEE